MSSHATGITDTEKQWKRHMYGLTGVHDDTEGIDVM
jgi:hypothetical protein